MVYGVGGIGKTSFLLRAVEDLARATGGRVVYHACRDGESAASFARAVVGERDAPGGPTTALLAASAARPLIVCLDDLHRAGSEAGLLDAIVHLAHRRAALWICAASREDLAVDPVAVDHIVIRLGGLSGPETRLLWSRLEQLYGSPRRSFAVDRDTGNPLLIKHSFAGPGAVSPADPLGLSALSPAAADLLAFAVAFRHPVPESVLVAGRPPDQAAEALATLERRFLLEPMLPATYAVHDVVREQVARSPHAPGPAVHRRCIAALRDWPTAGVDREREVLHHTIGCGDDERALQMLRARSSPEVRALPPGAVIERDLAGAIDRLAERVALPVPVRLLRERIRWRRGGAVHAHRAVRALAATGDPLAALDHAEIALALGRSGEALEALEATTGRDELGPLGRMWAAVLTALAHNVRGDVDRARRALDRAAATFTGALGEAVRRACDVVIEADREDYAAACAAVADVRRLVPTRGVTPLGVRLMTSVDRIAAAALGHAIAADNDDDLFDETLLFRVAVRLLRAQEHLIRGRARAAAELLGPTVDMAAGAGFGPFVWWGAWLLAEAESITGSPVRARRALEVRIAAARSGQWGRAVVRMETAVARALLAAGSRDEARRVASAALHRAHDLPTTRARLRAVELLADATAAPDDSDVTGLTGHAREEWRLTCAELHLRSGRLAAARREARETTSRAELAGWRLLRCQALLVEATVCCMRGDAPSAERAVTSASADAEREGYARCAVRASLIAAALLRLRGEDARSALELAADRARELELAVEAEAAEQGLGRAARAGSTTAGSLADRLGLCEPIAARLRDSHAVYALTARQLDALDERRYPLVFDLVRRRVRVGERVVDLTRRAALVDFLAVLARRPGHTVANDAIARALWNVEYHPLDHHSRLTVQATRLRKAVGGDLIVGEAGSYRLAVAGEWAVIEPAVQ